MSLESALRRAEVFTIFCAKNNVTETIRLVRAIVPLKRSYLPHYAVPLRANFLHQCRQMTFNAHKLLVAHVHHRRPVGVRRFRSLGAFKQIVHRQLSASTSFFTGHIHLSTALTPRRRTVPNLFIHVSSAAR